MRLSKEELVRYSRQLLIPDVGPEGQLKLKASRVAVIGLGGLGTLVLGYLAGAGVGEIGLFDSGPVELSNLHRQLIYGTGDVGRLKTDLAERYVSRLNPNVKATAHEGALTAGSMAAALERYDHVAVCTDNFASRSAANKACLELGKTYVHGAVYRFEGQLAVFDPRRGPCLECLIPGAGAIKAPTGRAGGVAGPAAGTVASMQALEIMKLMLGVGTTRGRFITLDLRSLQFHAAEFGKNRDCPACGGAARFPRSSRRA